MPHTPATQDELWTTRRLLRWVNDYFTSKNVDSPRITAELLLASALVCDRMRLYMEVDRPATAEERERLREMVRRVGEHEPVQYVLGEALFYGRSFEVDPATLIPRPSTESLVDRAVQIVRARDHGAPSPRVADIGTGTGCIAISLACALPETNFVATDLDQAIVQLAQRNATRHGVDDRITFRSGDLFAPIASNESFDVICSNPPYIPDGEWPDVPRNVAEYEPHAALRGGSDGLDVLRPLIETAPTFLKPGGWLIAEIAHCQRDQVLDMCAREYVDAEVGKDHEGFWRVLAARVPGA